MIRGILIFFALGASLFAQLEDWRKVQQQAERQREMSTGIDSGAIKNIREHLGATDTSKGDSIIAIAPGKSGFGQRDSAAVIKDEGNGAWSIHVFRRGFVDFKEVWSERQTDLIDSSCPAPQIYLTKTDLRTTIWQRSAPTLMCERWKRRVYVRKKDQFLLKETKEEAAICELGCYHRLAAQVLSEDVPREQTLGIVLALPSFMRERAYVLGRDSGGSFLIRREFTRQLWSQLEIMSSRKTTDEALALARGIPIATSRVAASAEQVQALVNGLSQIAPHRLDICPRRNNGDCALMVDGRSFHLWLEEDPPFKITDVSEPKYRSENPRALRWVYEVMAAAGDE